MNPIKMFGLATLTAMAFVGASSAMAEDPTALCKVDPGEGLHEECPEGQLAEHVHQTTLEGKKAILLAKPKVECDVLFLGEVLTEGLVAESPERLLISGNFTYTNCGGCTVTEENGPADLKLLKAGHEEGTIEGEGLVHVNCIDLNCYYIGEGLRGHVLGQLLSKEIIKHEGKEYEVGKVELHEQEVQKEKGLLCPSVGRLDILTYDLPLEIRYLTEGVAVEDPTALCKVDPGEGLHEECPAGQLAKHVHQTSLEGKKAILLASPKVECDVLFLGDVLTTGLLAAAGEKLLISGNFTYTNCGGCTITEENGPAHLNILKTGHEEGTVKGEGLVHVNCIGINCYYNGEGLNGHTLGPLLAKEKIKHEGKEYEVGKVELHEQEVKKEKGFFCPSKGKLDILTYDLPLLINYLTE